MFIRIVVAGAKTLTTKGAGSEHWNNVPRFTKLGVPRTLWRFPPSENVYHKVVEQSNVVSLKRSRRYAYVVASCTPPLLKTHRREPLHTTY